MEHKNYSTKITETNLDNKTNKIHKSDETDNSSAIIDSSFELSFDYLIAKEVKPEIKAKIPGFDDIKIPTFLNDLTPNPKAKQHINNYKKLKEELGSPELAKLYLIDIKNLNEQ